MMANVDISRAKACFYWNDIPSGIPGDDVLVLSFDDPERDRKSTHFENSTGAPLVAEFLKHDSAERVFAEFFTSEYMLATTPEFFNEIWNAWRDEFSKIPDFFAPDKPQTLIETVCRHRCKEFDREPDALINGVYSGPNWTLYEDGVRDLVKVMVSPSLRMIIAGEEARRNGWTAKEIWQAMIVEALTERPL
jgi:hypothetical protein